MGVTGEVKPITWILDPAEPLNANLEAIYPFPRAPFEQFDNIYQRVTWEGVGGIQNYARNAYSPISNEPGIGPAVGFDNVGTQRYRANGVKLDAVGAAGTAAQGMVAIWVRMNAVPGDICGWDNDLIGASQRTLFLRHISGAFRLTFDDGVTSGSVVDTSGADPNVLNKIVFGFTAAGLSLRVNATQTSAGSALDLSDADTPFQVGGIQGSGDFDGSVLIASVYNRALAPGEVDGLFTDPWKNWRSDPSAAQTYGPRRSDRIRESGARRVRVVDNVSD